MLGLLCDRLPFSNEAATLVSLDETGKIRDSVIPVISSHVYYLF